MLGRLFGGKQERRRSDAEVCSEIASLIDGYAEVHGFQQLLRRDTWLAFRLEGVGRFAIAHGTTVPANLKVQLSRLPAFRAVLTASRMLNAAGKTPELAESLNAGLLQPAIDRLASDAYQYIKDPAKQAARAPGPAEQRFIDLLDEIERQYQVELTLSDVEVSRAVQQLGEKHLVRGAGVDSSFSPEDLLDTTTAYGLFLEMLCYGDAWYDLSTALDDEADREIFVTAVDFALDDATEEHRDLSLIQAIQAGSTFLQGL